MAKKVMAYIKLQPLDNQIRVRLLDQHWDNMAFVDFVRQRSDAKTEPSLPIQLLSRLQIVVTFITKTPGLCLAAKSSRSKKSSGRPNKEKVGG